MFVLPLQTLTTYCSLAHQYYAEIIQYQLRMTYNLQSPTKQTMTPSEERAAIDQELSRRFIELDPAGYFLIAVDHQAGIIYAEHYTNVINEKGLACDPETGKPLPVRGGKVVRQPTATFTGRTAKELGMKITEQTQPPPLTKLDHALYLGRELVRAEIALVEGQKYIQD